MESGRVTREWLEGLDPAEFQEISAMISDVQRERAMARRQKLEQRQSVARKKKGRNSRYLELERVKCGKKGCRKCASGELHGPYWYLYRPKENRPGRTSQYVGKVLPETLAEEFDIPEDQRTSN
ncbi:MAG TPA: hypothetical protein VKA82_10115 [Rubrobacter sp.]|jgi:hypothetical protein|nr:hypothetical protein [Rubrobacter sp.]